MRHDSWVLIEEQFHKSCIENVAVVVVVVVVVFNILYHLCYYFISLIVWGLLSDIEFRYCISYKCIFFIGVLFGFVFVYVMCVIYVMCLFYT